MMSSHYPSKRTNKEKLIPLHVNNCECGIAVGRSCLPWGQGLGFDQWWYPLLHTAPPFLQKKKTHKKNKQKIIIIIKKKTKTKIFWTMWWLDPSPGYVGNLVSFTEFSHVLKKKKTKIFWTTWWLDPSQGYVGNLVSFAKFSLEKKKWRNRK